MARGRNKLSALAVKKAKPGKLEDGGDVDAQSLGGRGVPRKPHPIVAGRCRLMRKRLGDTLGDTHALARDPALKNQKLSLLFWCG